jgi:hypothetical protein
MRRAWTALLTFWPLAAGEVVDQVLVSVGLQVITGSAVRRQEKLDAFFAGKAAGPAPASRRAIAERLVDQALVRREVELSRFVPPSMAETQAQAARVRADMKLSEAAFAAALKKASISEEAFLEEVRWQITLFRFIDFRFRPAVQVSDDEVREYYEGDFLTALRQSAPGQEAPPIEEVRGRIAAVVTERKLQKAIEAWIEQSRQQVKIRWHEEALR